VTRVADGVDDGCEAVLGVGRRRRRAGVEACQRRVEDGRVAAGVAKIRDHAAPRPERLAGDGIAAPDDGPAREPRLARERFGNGRLAHARVTEHEQHAGTARGGLGERRPGERETVLPPGRAGRGRFGRPCPGWRRHGAARGNHTTGRAPTASRRACAFVRSAGG
jgi:hypothetical protein